MDGLQRAQFSEELLELCCIDKVLMKFFNIKIAQIFLGAFALYLMHLNGNVF